MPDIGLLQGAPRRRRDATPPLPGPPGEEAAGACSPVAHSVIELRGEPAGGVAVRYAAPPDRSHQARVVSEPGVVAEAREVEPAPLAAPPVSAVGAAAPPPGEPAVASAPAVPASTGATVASTPPDAPAAPSEAPSPAPSASVPVTPPPLARAAPPPIRAQDLLWLALALLVIIGTGIGSRDPWPADEPRFAAVARDMVATGEWLFPRVGGDLYQDKPPLFFWLLAVCYTVFGSLKASFLVPAFLAAGGTLFCIYDLGRRMVSREAGLAAAILTVSTLQFVITLRGAQIDPMLCFLVTFSVYAMLRHLVLGPSWGWYLVGGITAGLGVITKGVGFLPMLMLIPYFLLRGSGWRGLAPVDGGRLGWRWWLAADGMIVAVCLWFVPMLIAVSASGAPEYAAYRDEILFKQTVGRYAAAWHHVKPWYYFIVEVIPALWLPWSLLLFWLVPRFRHAFRERDARVWLPLGWALLVLLFFSLSPGKRGVYVLPALPALAMASLPFIVEVLSRPGVRRAGRILAGLFFAAAATLAIAHAVGAPFATRLLADGNLASATPLYVYLLLCGAGLVVSFTRLPLIAWPAAVGALAIVFSYFIAPAMNAERSGSGFVKAMLTRVQPGEELGLVAYKEQFLLYLDRPTVNFGHRRWLEGPQEMYDAALWLNAAPDRVLLMPEEALEPCFSRPDAVLAGRSSDDDWYLVRGTASAECAGKGDATRAIRYRAKPPR
jgi:4-amino-4-deoxy-L-arabinose transferase-like glycosyltransferase